MRHRSVEIGGLVENRLTFERFTTNPWMDKFIGRGLDKFVHSSTPITDHPENIVSVGWCWNEEKPEYLFPYMVVEWSVSEWLEMKLVGSKESIKRKEEKTISLLQSKNVLPKNLDESEEMKKFLGALEMYNGMITKASKLTGIPRSSHARWMRLPEYAEAVDIVKQSVIDGVEENLIEMALDGQEFQATKLFLSTHAKDRGYGDAKVEKVVEKSDLNLNNLTLEEQETFMALVMKAEGKVLELK